MPAVMLDLLTNPKVWLAAGFAMILGLLTLQTARLAHAKADLAFARTALIDPVTKRTWQAEEQTDLQNLGSCDATLDQAQATLSTQAASVAALKAAGDAASAKASVALRSAKAATVNLAAREEVLRALNPAGDACARADAILSGGVSP